MTPRHNLRRPAPDYRVCLFQGLVDVLEFVVRYPVAAKRIAAIVGIASAANGTPLADDVREIYRDWGADFPLPGCDKGTGAEVDDLRRDVRRRCALSASCYAMTRREPRSSKAPSRLWSKP
jgi:hypothetical protein